MSMQLDLEVVDGLRKIARASANVLYWVDGIDNFFRVVALNENLPDYEFTDDALICYCGHENARIIFNNVVPYKILDMEVDQPITFNEQETGIELDKWRNSGATPLCVDYTESKKKTVTETLNIAAEIATEIRSKVSGGNPVVLQAEVEAKISMKLGFRYGKETTTEQSDGQKIGLTVPPWTYTTLTQKHGVADVRQRITTRCELDSDITFDSHGKWSKSFPSIKSLQVYFNGGGGGTDAKGEIELPDKFFNGRTYADYVFQTARDLTLTIVSDRIYRNVSTGDIIRVDSPIVKPDSYQESEDTATEPSGDTADVAEAAE